MNIFEITIQRRSGDHTPVVVEYRQSGGLPVRNEGRLELTEEILNAQVTPLDYGRALGKALFRDDVRDAFARALAQAGERLHVLLFVEDEKLTAWHWERLAAPVDGAWDFLSLNQRTPFSLYLPSVTDRRFPPIGRRDLRALIIAASPADLEQRYGLKDFDVGKAVAGVRAGLGEIPNAVLADVTKVPDAVGPPTLDALAERITAEPITLLHFVCHGRTTDKGETVIYLADAENRVAPVPASQLIERLRRLEGARGLPRFAFLSTCESAAPESETALGGLGQRLVRDLGMPAVIAMTQKVSVATAGALAAAFYPRLREHGQPDLALVEAGAALAARHDITVPALYSRLGGLPLFSDALDRSLAELTNQEIKFGLARLEGFLQERAPVLRPEFDVQAATLRKTLDTDPAGLGADALKEREQALTEINSVCGEALDLRFVALALGEEPPAYDARCPFQGLPAFGYEQRAFFFGREQLIARLRERLGEHNFLAVQGPSGSGKSSLVMAGLIPALEQQHPGLRWSVIKPGDDIPLASIGNRKTEIENPSSLLVVDQFEELFTLTTDAKQRQAFIDRLLATAQAQLVVLTMRADFWGECAFYPALKAEMQAHQELIPPMSLAELRSAMEQQAQSVGLRFEADLANTLLDDVAGEPGAMPLLQHALLELWKRRHGRWLRAEEYRELGRVQGAIARTADGVYASLPPDDQARVRDIMLRLVRLDEAERRRDTRRRVTMDELVTTEGGREATVRLVARLADEKLLVTGADPTSGAQTVDLAHEALISQWGRLRSWIDEDRTALRLHQALGQDAQEWNGLGRDTGALYRGARLAQAEEWAAAFPARLNQLEREFLAASISDRDHEAQETERRRQLELTLARKQAEEAELKAKTQARTAKRLRVAVILLSIVLAVPALIVVKRLQQIRSPWEQVSGFPRNGVGALVAAPAGWLGSGHYYCAGTTDTGLGCSRDGERWNTYRQDYPTGTPGLSAGILPNTTNGISAIAIDATTPGRIYLGLFDHGVYRSSDGGVTVEPSNTGLPAKLAPRALTANNGLVLAILAVEGRDRLYASRDEGENWIHIESGSEPDLGEIHAAQIAADGQHVLIGTEKGIFSSPRDDLTAWRQVASSPPVWLIEPAPGISSGYYLATWAPDARTATLYRWREGGEPTQLATFGDQPRALVADPSPETSQVAYLLLRNNRMYAVDEQRGTVELGAYPGWLNFISTHYDLLAVPKPEGGGSILWLANMDGLYRYKGDLASLW